MSRCMVLHAPAVIHELDGQPVEQLLIRWAVALASEIVRRGHDAAPEMSLPDAVHHHARGQRIVARRDPLRQRFPPARNEPRRRRLRRCPAPARRRPGQPGFTTRPSAWNRRAAGCAYRAPARVWTSRLALSYMRPALSRRRRRSARSRVSRPSLSFLSSRLYSFFSSSSAQQPWSDSA